MLPQDLHIHTVFSTGDSAVMPQQTPEFVASVNHAQVRGISDHIEYIDETIFPSYEKRLRSLGFHVGMEIVQYEDVEYSLELPLEYRVIHCYNEDRYYKAAERMVETGVPLIIAHPMAVDTNLSKVPTGAYIEISNRYVWRKDWASFFPPHQDRFQFVFSSDAHQPHWLNQVIARQVGETLGIQESILFEK